MIEKECQKCDVCRKNNDDGSCIWVPGFCPHCNERSHISPDGVCINCGESIYTEVAG